MTTPINTNDIGNEKENKNELSQIVEESNPKKVKMRTKQQKKK